MGGIFKKWIRHPALTLVCRLIVGGIFVLASFHKILDPQSFASAIYNYKLFPPSSINGLAILLPWVELLAGMALILGVKIRGAALILSGLLASFAVVLVINLSRGLDIACGCFSSEGGKITSWYILRDLSLLSAALQVLFFDRGKYRLLLPGIFEKYLK